MRLRGHPLSRWRIVLEAVFTLLWVKLTLKLFSFSRYKKELAPQPQFSADAIDRQTAAELVWAVDRLSARAPNALNCLPRALAVQRLLRRRGAEGRMRFGIRKTETGQITAHAWLTLHEEVIVGRVPHLDAYQELPQWPGAG